MPIYIDSRGLAAVLAATPASQNIMLTGRHGIGKSQILTRHFESQGMKVVTLFLGQMSDPGDLIGLPCKNTETGKTDFMPPYWFPLDGKPVVLFLDELNRARPEVLQTIMDLALNRRLAGRALPEGSRLISAVNDGEEYQLTDLDPALVSRFNIYAFRPTAQDWLLWAEKRGIDKRVTGFIAAQPEWLDGDGLDPSQMDSGLEKTPDRRAWEKVSQVIADIQSLDEEHKTLLAGIVGTKASVAFYSYLSGKKLLTAEDVLFHYTKNAEVLQQYEVHQLAKINDAIFRYLEGNTPKGNDKAVVKKNLAAYVLSLKDREEALAHFASLFADGGYKKVVSFIILEAPKVYSAIRGYIETL